MSVLEDYRLAPVTPAQVTGLNKIETKGVVNSTEIVGIEVEVENARGLLHNNPNRVWVVTEDHSLRNGGIELITRPIYASSAPVCLQYLLHHFLNQDCCFSPRTSVHVHLNVQDITRAQVMDTLLMYVLFEKMFYKFVGQGRQKNIYCVPLTDTNLLTNLVDYGETRDGNWQKYTGLNTLPIREHGTIEFRHMHGTDDVEKLSTWIGLICKLKEYVRNTSTKEIRAMIAAMNDGFDFQTLMGQVFGELAGKLRYEGPQEMGYLHAKQAMVTSANATTLLRNYNSESAFAKFKG